MGVLLATPAEPATTIIRRSTASQVGFKFISVFIVLIALGAILNGAVIWLVRKHRSLQTITNLWVCSLCTSQLFISSISLFIALISTANGDWIFGKFFCRAYGYVTFL